MTTVTAGNTASFEMGPFDTITLTSSKGFGTLALTSQAPKLVGDQTLSIQNGTFGPWGAPMSVVMTVRQGSVDYTVNVKSLTETDAAAAQALVSGAGIGNPSSYYLACVPGRQFVTSGVPKDLSANGADLILGSALTDANLWATDGWMNFAALANGFAYIPFAKASFNLAVDSIIFSVLMNKAAPGATEYLAGNSANGGNNGFRLAVKTTGKVQPVFTTSDGNFGAISDTPCVFADGANHVFTMAVDAPTKSVYIWRDGALAMSVSSAYTGATASTTGVALAVQDSTAGAAAGALKAAGLHFLKFAGAGLPQNINKIAARLASRPYDFLTDLDIQR